MAFLKSQFETTKNSWKFRKWLKKCNRFRKIGWFFSISLFFKKFLFVYCNGFHFLMGHNLSLFWKLCSNQQAGKFWDNSFREINTRRKIASSTSCVAKGRWQSCKHAIILWFDYTAPAAWKKLNWQEKMTTEEKERNGVQLKPQWLKLIKQELRLFI